MTPKEKYDDLIKRWKEVIESMQGSPAISFTAVHTMAIDTISRIESLTAERDKYHDALREIGNQGKGYMLIDGKDIHVAAYANKVLESEDE